MSLLNVLEVIIVTAGATDPDGIAFDPQAPPSSDDLDERNSSPPWSIGYQTESTYWGIRTSARADQALFEAFILVRTRIRGPLVAVSERTMITNAGASELMQPADRRILWDFVRNHLNPYEEKATVRMLSNGLVVSIRSQPIRHADTLIGAIIRLSPQYGPDPDGVGLGQVPAPSDSLDSSLLSGWIDLTDSERTVAELIARGLTNKEASLQLFISRHTVDSHLRQVFRTLGVNSRVELARLIGEHYELLQARAGRALCPADVAPRR
jgi:DNA-binding CsgD family transcriptional regulator